MYDDPDDWATGVPVNLSALQKPNGLGLGEREARGDSFLWVAAHTRGEVVQINTRTCQVEGAHRSWGVSPSRTAVAADGSVWVGNRGWGGDASDYRIGNAVHLNVDGTLICRARITGTRGVAVRALALDQEGNAWIGSWDKRKLYQ